MRPATFFLILFRYNRDKEQSIRLQLETARLQTTALINVQLKQTDRIKPPQLWKLPWDDEHTEIKPELPQVKELYQKFRDKHKADE